MKSLLPIAALSVLAFAVTGCVKPDRYRWDSYESGLYDYYKNPARADAYAEQLAVTVKAGETDGRIAPGLHAEYGYMLWTMGKPGEAIAEFNAEKKRWPESTVLMDRMIKLVGTKPARSAAINASDKK